MKRKEILEALNKAKEIVKDRPFRMTELRALSAEFGYRGNNNFWQIFKEKQLEKVSTSTYRFKDLSLLNQQQLFAVKEEEHIRYPQNQVKKKKPVNCEECSEEMAIAFLKERGYRIFKIVTQEVEV